MITKELTWDTLVELEPKLQELYDRTLCLKPPPPVGQGDAWLEPQSLRAHLINLVGLLAPAEAHPLLRTMDAYTLAYRKILDAFIRRHQ
jgi:hypothetical protein